MEPCFSIVFLYSHFYMKVVLCSQSSFLAVFLLQCFEIICMDHSFLILGKSYELFNVEANYFFSNEKQVPKNMYEAFQASASILVTQL